MALARDVVIGARFGHLVVAEHRQPGQRVVLCECDCGTVRSFAYDHLGNGTRSCGHTHGMSATKIYKVWAAMLDRTRNPNSQYFDYYGGRGINVCERWKSSFENFYADMGDPPVGTSLDRIDNDGNYEPSNCRWSTILEQNKNRRRPRSPEDVREIRRRRTNGDLLRDIAADYGVSHATILNIVRGTYYPMDT